MFLFFLSGIVYAETCEIICPVKSDEYIEKENFFNKFSGINILSKKMVEFAIETELKKELNSKFTANLEIADFSLLKRGEFKSLILKSKNIKYRALSLSDFSANTLCLNNKIIYENKRLYYPYDLSFEFNANLTNDNLQNIINSEEFHNQVNRSYIKIGGLKAFSLNQPIIEIKNNKIYFMIPVKSFLLSSPVKISVHTGINVIDNKIELDEISSLSTNNIINPDIMKNILNKINPIEFKNEYINNKYCKIYIKHAKIEDNIIKINGIFIINQNYGRSNE